MDRLTSCESDCKREMICRYEDCDTCEEYCPYLNEDNCLCLQEVLEKLAEYEDLEEQGKLLKLPCAVGDTVYKIWSCGKSGKSIAEFIVSHIDIDFLPNIEFSYRKERGCGNYYFSKIDDIGKTVFLTKPEAEEALKKMNEKEGENG